MITLHDVCAVTPGVCSTLGNIIEYTGGVQYTEGYCECTRDVQYSGEYCEYTGGDTMMSVGDIVSTPGVFSTLGDTIITLGGTMMSVEGIIGTAGVFSTLRDTMSTPRGYHDERGGYHEYTGGCSVHWGFHTNSIVSLPYIYHDSPQCTHDIPLVY